MSDKRDKLDTLADLGRRWIRHRGDLKAVQAELDEEREWARFCARHGLPRNTPPPTD